MAHRRRPRHLGGGGRAACRPLLAHLRRRALDRQGMGVAADPLRRPCARRLAWRRPRRRAGDRDRLRDPARAPAPAPRRDDRAGDHPRRRDAGDAAPAGASAHPRPARDPRLDSRSRRRRGAWSCAAARRRAADDGMGRHARQLSARLGAGRPPGARGRRRRTAGNACRDGRPLGSVPRRSERRHPDLALWARRDPGAAAHGGSCDAELHRRMAAAQLRRRGVHRAGSARAIPRGAGAAMAPQPLPDRRDRDARRHDGAPRSLHQPVRRARAGADRGSARPLAAPRGATRRSESARPGPGRPAPGRRARAGGDGPRRPGSWCRPPPPPG